MIKILNVSSIASNNSTLIKNEIADILKIKDEDEIIFVLDENNRINVKRYPVPLVPGEKFLSSSRIGEREREKEPQFYTHISPDIVNIIELDEYRKILWILDKNGNIIIKNVFLSSECTKYILGHKISAMIISLSKIRHLRTTTLPSGIVEILDINIGDTIAFYLNEFNNIVVTTIPNRSLGIEVKVLDKYVIYFTKIMEILNVNIGDNILWILDENGNIIIKNIILHDSCY
jgi:bifunctional DNA-binding transcriptional regulator/antitoxin component of YhaV-PrlF toxin-antitoxin module